MLTFKQTFIPNMCKQTGLSVEKQKSKVRIYKSLFPTFKHEFLQFLCCFGGDFFVLFYFCL